MKWDKVKCKRGKFIHKYSGKQNSNLSVLLERCFNLRYLSASCLPRGATASQKPVCCWRGPDPAGAER